jgi:uncharacterized protein (DUF924 family)
MGTPSLEEVERVWQFWFGVEEGCSLDALSSRWFPLAHGGEAAQAAADERVEDQCGALLDAAVEGRLDGWSASPSAAACRIVVLDQFSRHVYRRRRAPPGCQAAADAAALAACEQLLARPGWTARLTLPEHVFALMPLRHSASLSALQRCMEQAAAREALHGEQGALLRRFRTATLRRLRELEGRQWTEGDEILERPHALGGGYVQGEAAAALLRHPLARSVTAWLRGRPRCDVGAADAAGSPPVRALVSLSGGVDSMALCAILAAAGRAAAPPFAVAAVHIDYGNRPESAAEASFVQAWCRECARRPLARCPPLPARSRALCPAKAWRAACTPSLACSAAAATATSMSARAGAFDSNSTEAAWLPGRRRAACAWAITRATWRRTC